mmetsp:Transcript_6795/g.7756  ORF Transcript_6795/g.7756 Transcript_6795/m.7756 type:complete len:378 (-) Transcript_6795:319-1452(-)
MYDDEQSSPLVFDVGTSMTKAGFCGDDIARVVFPTIVGTVKKLGVMIGQSNQSTYVGDEAISRRGILNLKYPMHAGLVQNWDELEKVWHHTFYNELRLSPEDQPLVVVQNLLTPAATQERIITLMFEQFNVPAFYTSSSAGLSLIGTGRTTGLVVEIGAGANLTVPVYEGMPLTHLAKSMNIAGETITDYLVKLLSETYPNLTDASEKRLINELKESIGRVALDYEIEIERVEEESLETPFELPDGSILNCKTEHFRCAEPLFKPSLIGLDTPGIAEVVQKIIESCDADILDDMRSICLAGGCTMLQGFDARLLKELNAGRVQRKQFEVLETDIERIYLPFYGASIVGSISTFKGMWITKEEYDESGPSIVHRKCFF